MLYRPKIEENELIYDYFGKCDNLAILSEKALFSKNLVENELNMVYLGIILAK